MRIDLTDENGPQVSPAIGDYALIGDCRTAALVSREGSIDWLCLPNFSSTSVFARILDTEHGGHFSIRPKESFSVTRRYLGPSAVLETTYATSAGRARVLDFLPIVDGIKSRRPLREVLRIIEGVEGHVEFVVSVDPRPGYGKISVTPRHMGAMGWRYAWRNEAVYIHTDFELQKHGRQLAGSLVVRPADRKYASLGYSLNEPAIAPPLGRDASDRLDQTVRWWTGWSAELTYRGPYRDAVTRSAITLKLLTYALSGAVIAAPTASLPESVGADRNWDYRYCWLRDAGLTVQALIGLGKTDDAKFFLDWLLHATRLSQPKLKVLYDVYGRSSLSESELEHFSGYRNSRPVRVGNEASTQTQLDAYGNVVLAADTFVSEGGTIDKLGARFLANMARVICKLWREPDSGIWEKRGKPQHYTFSKLMCWVALDRLLKLQERGAIKLDNRPHLEEERQAIADFIERECYDPEVGSYMECANSPLVDASILLMPCVGYKPADDEKIRSSFDVIAKRLRGPGGLLTRYEPDPNRPEPPEGAFGICCFWEVDQQAQRGEIDEAEAGFTRLLSLANDVGLFGEEFEMPSGSALGNFPQAFTHVGLINAAIALKHAHEHKAATQ